MKLMTARSTAINRKRRILKDGLSAETIEELRWKLSVAHDAHSDCTDNMDEETATEWDCTIAAIENVLATPTVKTLSLHSLAQTELDNSITSDMSSNDRHMIIRDLCRTGWFPEKSPTAVCTHEIKTVQVDGKVYEVGSYD